MLSANLVTSLLEVGTGFHPELTPGSSCRRPSLVAHVRNWFSLGLKPSLGTLEGLPPEPPDAPARTSR
jgi:hypothetical protein